jgi:hypothetical protein
MGRVRIPPMEALESARNNNPSKEAIAKQGAC